MSRLLHYVIFLVFSFSVYSIELKPTDVYFKRVSNFIILFWGNARLMEIKINPENQGGTSAHWDDRVFKLNRKLYKYRKRDMVRIEKECYLSRCSQKDFIFH